ncbi:MAG: cupin domain-containing protein [Thermoanaerobaculia bacterium]
MIQTLILLLVQAAAAAGTAEAPVPVGEEPRHKVVLENAFVRVIDATLPPGYVSLFHTHDRDNVPVAVLGGRIRTDMAGQPSREMDVVPGQAWFSPGGYSHRVTNVGPATVRFIDVEVLATLPAEAGAASELDGHERELESPRAVVYRLTLAPGASRAAHQHAKGVLRVTAPAKSSDASAEFSWHPSGRVPAVENGGSGPLEVVEIEWTGR